MNAPIRSKASHARFSLPTLGAAFILVGTLTLVFSRHITRLGLGDNQDPGPAAFPRALALFLIVGGLIESARWFRSRHESPPDADPDRAAPSAGFSGSRIKLSLLLLMLGAYIAALGWAGFALSTLVMAPLMMLLLGTKPGIAALNSLILVLMVKGLFGWALKVPLPAGELGFPF